MRRVTHGQTPSFGSTPTRTTNTARIAVTVAGLLYTTASLLSKRYGWAYFSIPFFVGWVSGLLDARRTSER